MAPTSVIGQLATAASFFLSAATAAYTNTTCRCAPTDACWPSASTWSALNETVSGQLIKTEPIAISCYPGPLYDATTCDSVDEQWTDPRFQSLSPVGLDYPINITCPPLNLTAGQTGINGSCTIGTNPWYAVNATCVSDVSAAVKFAADNNVRLVIKDTGHDILGRSDGYGSLEVWIKYLRTELDFSASYTNVSTCHQTNWTGSTITIGGGYTFDDVYKVAEANKVVVVGGGTPSVGALGGWMQGGGHGPASRNFGLGADQVLEAEVVLADGSVVTASPCEHQDLFFAIRGGGPGTYGVVTKTVVKTYPMVNVSVQHLAIGPLTSNTTGLLDAVTIMFEEFPNLNDAGYAGYGTWSVNQPTPLFSTFNAGYVHGIYMMDSTVAAAEAAFASTLERLKPYNISSGGNLFISVSYVSYPDYWTFYTTESGVESVAGSPGVLGSRLFSRADVSENTTGLRNMIQTIAGTPEQYTSNNFEIVSGGANFEHPADFSGLNPAWRISYFNNICARGWAPGTNQSEQNAIWADVTRKFQAMEAQTPETGVYMNEGDRLDPNWAHNFYGAHYESLLGIKERYDPRSVFYCPTCVGSAEWAEVPGDEFGRLCRVG